ncbi:serine hydrolase domain-containing protein [Caenibius tardaugens]|uniref:serine hydrolase domain-containing protein n=2 Tax=Caenibius tardaugens TaxID=169176 RepID=UPI001375B116|nr:serine hydrolase domain-containing protein [Caenibius tardaugens]
MSENIAFSPSRRKLLQALGAIGVMPLAMPKNCEARSRGLLATRGVAQGIVKSKVCPGVVVGVGQATEEPQFVSEGSLSFDSKERVDKNTLWRIYSMTKPITGMAAMLLIAEGKLTLDQPVSDFFSAFSSMQVLVDPKSGTETKPARNPITVRHLMTHTSGIGSAIPQTPSVGGPLADRYVKLGLRNGVFQANGQPDMDGAVTSLREFAERLATVPLETEPGTRWRYSLGLDLLGAIIEVVSGRPFDIFLKEAFFDPLGMRSTWFRVPEHEKRRLVDNYATANGMSRSIDTGVNSLFLKRPTYPSGGGGLVSSARDYDRFLMMLVRGGTLDGATVMPPSAIALGTSNLLPEGTDMSGYIYPSSGDGFGAGGRLVMSGPHKGAFGWLGAAGTLGMVNCGRQLRLVGMLNCMGDMSLPRLIPDAVNKDISTY